MRNKVIISFEGHLKEEEESVIMQKEFDIDFNGVMMVRFAKHLDDKITAINGMDGHGNNILQKIIYKEAQVFYPNKPLTK